ncbi:MAG: carboxypeptidase-like regulatory domain-containing protein [Burkholderiales bacterium]
MPQSLRHRPISLAIAAAFAAPVLLLSACGGGGGGGTQADTTPVPTVTVSGVVATGLPVVGAPVSIVDSSGAQRSAVTDATGAFSVDATGLVAPIAAVATLPSGARLVSVLSTLPAGTARMNVSPLTDAIAARLSATGDPAALLAPAALQGASAARVSAAVAEQRAALASQLAAAGLDAASFDPIATPFVADGTGADRLLDRIDVRVSGGTVELRDRFAPPEAAAVSLAGAVGASPAVLAAPAVDGPGGPALAALRTRMQACLDVPLAQRATVDGAGRVTGVHPTCAAVAAPDYRHNGYAFGPRYQQVLTESQYATATVGNPVVAFLENGAATLRLPIANASGLSADFAEVVAQRGGAWTAVGNQRKYDAFVEFRALRLIPVNAANATPGSDRIRLLLLFNPEGPSGGEIAVARVKGPGLPAEGVSLTRSRTCGTSDFMAIFSKTGAVLAANGQNYAWWTSNQTSPNFELAAANPTSPSFAWAGSAVNWRDTPMSDADVQAQIPRYARYTFEVFRPVVAPALPSGVPDETFTVRLAGDPFPASGLASLPWATLSPQTIAAALTPGGANAGATASVPMSWTMPAGFPVFSIGGFSIEPAAGAAPSTGLTALRRNFGQNVDRGATSAPLQPTLDGQKPGTADTPFIGSGADRDNAGCATAAVGALDASANTYRELTLSQRAPGNARMSASWFRQNP